ncbi:MAG: hypothetical protein Q4C83_01070 [Candidatus Saccharibacteria bacterium]|nr:hypothetical protein [Candidatus Saccharibacteria bacterium]
MASSKKLELLLGDGVVKILRKYETEKHGDHCNKDPKMRKELLNLFDKTDRDELMRIHRALVMVSTISADDLCGYHKELFDCIAGVAAEALSHKGVSVKVILDNMSDFKDDTSDIEKALEEAERFRTNLEKRETELYKQKRLVGRLTITAFILMSIWFVLEIIICLFEVLNG